MIVIDGSNKILGRLASKVAKLLLEGNQVVVVNVEKVLLKKTDKRAFELYKRKVDRGNPYSGPFFPKRADLIFVRTVRGMLPYKKEKGRKALKRLKVYFGVPKEFEKTQFYEIREVENNFNFKTISLYEISKSLGANYYE